MNNLNLPSKSLSEYLNEIGKNIENLKERHKKYCNREYIFAYRGECQDYGDTKLMPSIFREKEDVNKEKYLFELLSDYGFFEDRQMSMIEQAIESQHFLALSRMLDISFSILPALFFACSGSEEEDGRLYVFCFPEYYSPHSTYIEEFYKQVLAGGTNITYSSNFKVISHSFSNERIKAQVGGFIFFPGYEYKPISKIYYKEIIVYKNDKKRLLEELEILFGIKESTLFPEKDKLAQSLKQKFKEKEYKNSKITFRGEIEAYFKHIEYELAMCDREETKNRMQILRMLRKEKSDLMYYILHADVEEKEKKELIEFSNSKFDFYEQKYGGR